MIVPYEQTVEAQRYNLEYEKYKQALEVKKAAR